MLSLIIDEGNSRVKCAVYENTNLLRLVIGEVEEIQKKISDEIENHQFSGVILSTVNSKLTSFIQKKASKAILLDYKTPVPFINKYNTKATLGVDRIALMAAAVKKFPNQNTLVIDAGTCITYDFMNDKNEYLGGVISPGLQMKYKAMHDYTGKLPLISAFTGEQELIGVSTETCMKSGVINGTVFEIEGMIENYQKKFENLNIIITGGDANSLYKQLKNSIFVNPNFLLEGLNEILTHQI